MKKLASIFFFFFLFVSASLADDKPAKGMDNNIAVFDLETQDADKKNSRTLTGGAYSDAATGMEFVFVKGGCYQMGDTFGDGYNDEKPVHEVCVDDFYMGKYEVTQGQWQKIMGKNQAYFKDCGENCPAEQVSWNDAQEFINKLNEKITPAISLNKGDNPLLFPLNKGGNRGLYENIFRIIAARETAPEVGCQVFCRASLPFRSRRASGCNNGFPDQVVE